MTSAVDPTPQRPSIRLVTLLLAVGLLLPACASKQSPTNAVLAQRGERTPVVLVPGITGTVLYDTESGKAVWGQSRNLFGPHDGGYNVAVPLDPDEDRGDSIEPAGPVMKIKLLGFIKYEVYGPLILMMERSGYRLGDLDQPRPDQSFFVFSYDWRYTNERAARELTEALERLRQARGEPLLEVDLVCHSNAGRIARWALKYGGGSLEQAEAGAAAPPPTIRARNLILVGADNGGGLDTLRTLDRGRTYVPLLGRKFRPEVMFSFEALFEALPVYRKDLFFDARGRLLDVDLFDAENWRRYGWSVFDEKTRRRIDRKDRADLFADEETRLARLKHVLDRSWRTHELLRRDVAGFADTRYHFIRSTETATGIRAMLKQTTEGRWLTYFIKDDAVKRDPRLSGLASVPGDGYVSEESQNWISAQEQSATAGPPHDVRSGHRALIRHPDSLQRILEILAAP
jgi:hypothetical protein